jgi:hypothetical protein
MRVVAVDEIRHAALLIAAWIEPRPSPPDADRIGRACDRAVREFREELRSDVPQRLPKAGRNLPMLRLRQ